MTPEPTMTQDRGWQLFCLARYIAPPDGEPLSEYQGRVRQAIRKHGIKEAAETLGITMQRIRCHVTAIRAKGWDF